MPASDQGNLSGRYTVVLRTLIFVTKVRHVLLLKGAPNKRLWANLYNGIGGHVKVGEDIITSAHRELSEETGLSVSSFQLCGIIIVNVSKKRGICIFVFRGELDDKFEIDFKASRYTKEGILSWISLDEIPKLPVVEDLVTLLPRILSMKVTDPPFSAIYSYDVSGKLVISYRS